MPKFRQPESKEKTRLVLDTNVLISGVISNNGPCAAILDLISTRTEAVTVLLTDEIFAEYIEVLKRPRFAFNKRDLLGIINLLMNECIFIDISATVAPSSNDPDDNKFIACAVEGQAHFIITGNLRHYDNLSLVHTKIISPREFVTIMLL